MKKTLSKTFITRCHIDTMVNQNLKEFIFNTYPCHFYPAAFYKWFNVIHERVPIFMVLQCSLESLFNSRNKSKNVDKALLWSKNTRGVNTHKDTFKFTFNSNISLFTVSIVNCILNCYPHFSVRIYCPNSIRPRHLMDNFWQSTATWNYKMYFKLSTKYVEYV